MSMLEDRAKVFFAISVLLLWISVGLAPGLKAGEVHLTAMTFFGANDQGAVNPSFRWNTLYLDAAWDIALFEETVPPSVPVAWLNDNPTYGVDISLFEGEERTFGFCVSGRDVPVGYFGLNIFFEGKQDPSPGSPGISAVAFTDLDGPGVGEQPPFQAIPKTVNIMGWAIADVGGSGSLTYADEAIFLRVTMTDFAAYAPEALGVDLVQPQEPGGLRLTDNTDGFPDLFVQFTLKVEKSLHPPTDLVCARSADGKTVDLTWTDNDTYDSIVVRRDGAEIATRPGTNTSYKDVNVTPLVHTYEVIAVGAGEQKSVSCRVLDPANPEVFLTALTLFGTLGTGQVRFAERWNTLYPDAAWDIALHEGPTINDQAEFDPADPTFWLNRHDDMGIEISLLADEERTFSFYNARAATNPNWFGINLFFDGMEVPLPGTAGISVFAYTDEDGPGAGVQPEFKPNASKNTMGWPIENTPGANTLVYQNCDLGIQVTLTDFVTYYQSALYSGIGIDVVQAQEPGGLRPIDGQDGLPDFAGQFTLLVETFDCNPPPSDLFCTRSLDGKTADLSWKVNGTYDSLTVLRDGVEIASLAVNATVYQDTNVPAGSRTYEVISEANGKRRGPSCTVPDPAHPEVTITALTIFGTTSWGAVRIEERWNTLYLDAAWDVALHEGALVTDPGQYDPSTFWLNDPDDMSVKVPLMAGEERTFSFYMGANPTAANYYGLNLFFDGLENPPGGVAGISVFAFTDEDGPGVGIPPPFEADGAVPTMGWPIADIPGAGTLTYENPEKKLRVTLTDFVIFTPTAINGGAGIDFVQRQEPGDRLSIEASDLDPDLVGQFTLVVEAIEEPLPPEGLTAAGGKNQVSLSWSPPSGGPAPTGYTIYRDGAWIIDVPSAQTAYTDTSLDDGTKYCYRLTSRVGLVEGDPSEEACATTDPIVTEHRFRRGDANADGAVDLSDPVNVLGYLFLGTPKTLLCYDAADADDTGELDITDAVYNLNWQFLGGKEIPAPGPFICGEDPTKSDPFPECDYPVEKCN